MKSSQPDQEETKNRFMMFDQVLRSELEGGKNFQHHFIYLLIQTDSIFFFKHMQILFIFNMIDAEKFSAQPTFQTS